MNDLAGNIYAAGAAYTEDGYVPASQAKISVLDWGFTRSDCTYDVVHVFKGGFFRLEDHLDRFAVSMRKRRLAPPEDRASGPATAAVARRSASSGGLAAPAAA